MYIHDCPAERYIPIYLIVAGSVGIIANLMGLGKKAKNRNEPEEEQQENVKGNPLDYIINCFLLAWFIAGLYYILVFIHINIITWVGNIYWELKVPHKGTAGYEQIASVSLCRFISKPQNMSIFFLGRKKIQ